MMEYRRFAQRKILFAHALPVPLYKYARAGQGTIIFAWLPDYRAALIFTHMNVLITALKKFKPAHWLYNLLHYKSLGHNRQAFKQYQVNKPLFASISSKDFPDKTSRAWLDVGDSAALAPGKAGYDTFAPEVQEQLLNWSANGYMTLPHFVNTAQADAINKEIDRLVETGAAVPAADTRIAFANRLSPLIKAVTLHEKLTAVLAFILGKEVVPFQTLNFIKGSNQRAHSDSIHMTTYPLGYLIAVWIALENTNEHNGPLFYYPGSHKLPYLLNNDFNETSTLLQLGRKDYTDYEDVTAAVIDQKQLEKKVFIAAKGDVFIWHANLVHGGSPITDHALTRKSMVIHYYAKDVIKYHEITERPSLMED